MTKRAPSTRKAKREPAAAVEGEAATRRRGERDARIAWILDAALDVAISEGLGAVTTTKLASKLGYTVGAFYRYFDSIDALLAALHRRTAELFYDAFFAALAPARAQLLEQGKRRLPRVRALGELVLLPALYRQIADRHPRHFELVGQLVTRDWPWIDDAAQRRLEAIVLPRIQEIVSIAVRAAAEGALAPGDPIVRTMTLWIGVHATLSIGPLAERHRDLVDRDVLTSSMTRSLLAGWGATSQDLDGAIELAVKSLAAA